jgi:hypothetical protein
MNESGTTTSVNPYATPDAPVDDVGVGAAQDTFFAVGVGKLAVMSFVTLGFYELFWCYWQWKAASRISGEKLLAPVRALFAGVTSYFLFKRINAQGERHGVSIAAGPLAFAFFIMTALWRLPDPYWLICEFSFLPLLPVQAAINRINAETAPDLDPNTRFSGWNIFGIVVGLVFFALVIVGMFIPDGN